MKSNTKTIFTISLVILCATVAGYVIMFFAFNSLRTDLDGLYQISANHKAKLAELKKIENNLNLTLADKDKLSTLFVKQEGIVDFIQGIESTMKGLNLFGSIDSVSEESPVELNGTDKERLSMIISAFGTWDGVAKFIGLVEKLPYKSTIDSVSLQYGAMQNSAKEEAKLDTSSKWKVTIKVYALADKPAPQALDGVGADGQATNQNQ